MTESTSLLDLAPLIAALDDARTVGRLDRVVRDIAYDSRMVRPGSIFVALRGERADGHDFIDVAVAAGAGTIVVDRAFAATHAPLTAATTIVVPDTRRALSRLAAAFFDYPAVALRVVGITGTNGKTTTAYLVERLLTAGGIPTGRIGTLGAAFAGAVWPLERTTPLALDAQRLLAEMRERRAAAVAMEVSSHALVLERVADVPFAVGVLTNVTRDHLDFHGTFEAYAAAKRSLFEQSAEAVLDVDDAFGKRFADELRAAGRAPVTYGFAPDAQVRARDFVARAEGSEFVVDGRRFTLALPGRFNVENALAALCVARIFGVRDVETAEALAAFDGVPGRMEHVAGGDIDVLVDYAHTPAALEAILRAARETSSHELWVVFGCGGDRDRGKRPEMGRIAREFADRVVLTNDNPRGEHPQSIVAEILAGIAHADGVVVEHDRRSAIRRAVLNARAGDVVVVAGKGHETYQIVRGEASHFDDRDEVRAALAARETVR